MNLKQGIFLVTILAFAFLMIGSVSAAANITAKVNTISADSGVAVFAGESIPLEVVFTAGADSSDVRIKAWLAGSSGNFATTERFDVFNGKQYARTFSVPVPSNIDPNETLTLKIIAEDSSGELASKTINLSAQRSSYSVDVLDVNMDSQVKAGNSLPVDIVLKNSGYHVAEDTLVKISIPALNVQEKGYFGDLAPTDRPNDQYQHSIDMLDSVQRRIMVKVPANAPAGVYDVVIEAFNADSDTTTTRKVAVVSSAVDTSIVSPVNTRTFAPGEKVSYSTTLVNAGDKIALYEIVLSASNGLTVDTTDSVVAVPAGNSKNIVYNVQASNAGKYTFTASIYSAGNLVKTETFTANVEGTQSVAGNATVLLTVVLAIIFVVLLVVLIVLLTRKPEKKEEFGESYY